MTGSDHSGAEVHLADITGTNVSVICSVAVKVAPHALSAKGVHHPAFRVLTGAGTQLRRINAIEPHGHARDHDRVSIAYICAALDPLAGEGRDGDRERKNGCENAFHHFRLLVIEKIHQQSPINTRSCRA